MLSEQRTTARREGDVYVLNGEKMWISLATVAHNFLVFLVAHFWLYLYFLIRQSLVVLRKHH
ncbi:MAG TPA: hypothetical protein EYP06_08335, partial [Desulfobacterales bacterium]|nr:hypothetical protein [Desulfobacterales bacterium]